MSEVSVEDPNLALGPFLRPELKTGGTGRALTMHLANILGVMAQEPCRELSRVERRLLFVATERAYAENAGQTPTLLDWLKLVDRLSKAEPGNATAAASLTAQIRFGAKARTATFSSATVRPAMHALRCGIWPVWTTTKT